MKKITLLLLMTFAFMSIQKSYADDGPGIRIIFIVFDTEWCCGGYDYDEDDIFDVELTDEKGFFVQTTKAKMNSNGEISILVKGNAVKGTIAYAKIIAPNKSVVFKKVLL